MAADGDVAGVLAFAPGHAAVMTEHRRRLVALVAPLQSKLAAQECIAPARIDQVTRAHGERVVASAGVHGGRASLRIEVDPLDLGALARVDAFAARVLEEQLVELLALDVERV